MARFRTPPNKEDVLAKVRKLDAIQMLRLANAAKPTTDQGEYLHWDKFKWRQGKDVDAELAWFGTKFSRNSISKDLIKLTAKHDEHFKFCVPDSLWANLHYIDIKTGGGQKIGDSLFVSSRDKDRYLVSNLMMEEAITSSQLEGASTTRKVAKEMLKTRRKPQDKSEQMIVNNFRLMKRAVEIKDEPLTIDLIFELHSIATFNAIENEAIPGELRKDDSVSVSNQYNEVAHIPPSYKELKDRLSSLCEFANENTAEPESNRFIHPVLKAIMLHFMIGYIHPFGDGNGRTARALFYWFMLKRGYWLFEYVSISKLIQENRADYDLAYRYTESDSNDLTYFLYNQTGIIIKAVNALHQYIEKKRTEFYQFKEWIDKSPVSKRLKNGAIDILKTAVKQPGRTFTAKLVAQDLDVNENTARTYLNTLVDEGLLMTTNQKGHRGVVYIAPASLREQLKI
ncbi:Fic family protein [Celerinatantimonas sp. YJH-8]|uniref:Fic family protein n=1 Tax=Celerinatantimonas sp. YJH-8 TaxID=3228714 RepID=UPI0038CB4889